MKEYIEDLWWTFFIAFAILCNWMAIKGYEVWEEQERRMQRVTMRSKSDKE
jgi:hypothetical protein